MTVPRTLRNSAVRAAAGYLLDVTQGMDNNVPGGECRDASDQPHLGGEDNIAGEAQGKAPEQRGRLGFPGGADEQIADPPGEDEAQHGRDTPEGAALETQPEE